MRGLRLAPRRRWACTCTFRSAASAASSATSASTPTRTASDVEQYVAALSREIELVSRLPVMGGRPFRFVYFGGGTPSFLSAKQLTSLVDRLRANINWDQAEEVTFECEPGTLSQPKVDTLQGAGRHAPQPGRRELRRRRARRKRPGPSVGRKSPNRGSGLSTPAFPTSTST